TGLARKPAAHHRADDVVLSVAAGCDQRLAQDHAQHRTREINLLVLAVDLDATRAGLQPHARDRVLALAGGIGAALFVELLLLVGLDRRGILHRRLDERGFKFGKIAYLFGHWL